MCRAVWVRIRVWRRSQSSRPLTLAPAGGGSPSTSSTTRPSRRWDAGDGQLDPLDLQDAGVGRLAAPAGKERAPVEHDTVGLDPGDLGIEGGEVGVALVQRLGHLTTLS